MKYFTGKTILVLLYATIIGCSKPDELSSGEENIVYYDYLSNKPAYPVTNDSLDCSRVCYNITEEKVVWIKKNEKAIKISQIENTSRNYAKSFLTGNTIIKLFATSAVPGDHVGRVTGIYFHKIDKTTGDLIVLKEIVTAAELNPTGTFYMSEVVTDGNYYFFSCSNNYVYCFDSNGNLVWKKGDHPMSNVYGAFSVYDGYTHMYYDEGKLYFATVEPTMNWLAIYGLDVNTGNRVFISQSVVSPLHKQLLFTSKRIINFSNYGQGIVDKNTGMDVGSNGQIVKLPIGKVTDTMIAIADENMNLNYINAANPVLGYVGTSVAIDPARYHLFTGGILHSASSYYDKTVLSCIDARLDVQELVWRKTFAYSNRNVLYNIFEVKRKGNVLFVFSNFKVENNQCVPNIKIENGVQKRYVSIIEVNAATGQIGYQSGELPTGRYAESLYNVIMN